MYETDKYPLETGRRRFVKGVVAGAALVSLGVGGASAVNLATNPTGRGGGVRQYVGIPVVAGPAPRAMPFVAVAVDDEGFLHGVWPEVRRETQGGREVAVAETSLGGQSYSGEWFQYCGVQAAPGVEPDGDFDDYLRYAADRTYEWQTEQVTAGDRVNVADFDDWETWGNGIGRAGLGKPATAVWRSEGASTVLPVQLLRVVPAVFDRMRTTSPVVAEWLNAASDQYFVAWLNKCTHFCCVPAFKATEQSARFGAEDRVYCPCHQSVYDPFRPVQQSFVALPRPTE
jgi:Rieske Fe-S protein